MRDITNGPPAGRNTGHACRGVFAAVLTGLLCLSLSAAAVCESLDNAGKGSAFAGCAVQGVTGLHGTVWKIISPVTNDEYVGFYDGAVYYLTGHDYIGQYPLSDSFYRDYDRASIASAVIPERLINYPGDVVVWGIMLHRTGTGYGFSLPLPSPALLSMQTAAWIPE
jgi:hypothetical protein